MSYKQGNSIVYVHTVLIDNSTVATFSAKYPASEQKDMNAVINIMSKSLRAAD